MRAELADGRVLEFPDGTDPSIVQATVKKMIGTQPTQPEKTGFLDDVKGGIASAPINMYLGAKQMFGGLSPVEQDALSQNKEAANKAPVSSFVSNIATLAPAMLIPGANTVAGAALTGGASGALQPVEGEQSLGNIAKNKVLAATIGAGLGAASQYGGDKLGKYLQTRAIEKGAEQAALASKNSVRDATLKEAQDAGYTVPRSLYAPTFSSNRLESLAGKAATKQQAASDNQQITNSLARKALGMADDTPVSISGLEKSREIAAAPYREIASISAQAKADLEALKQARNDSQGWFNAYNRSASPADLAKAKEMSATANQLEQSLETHAANAGRSDLLPALADARKQIAKTYTVQRALNDATGDIAAPVIGRLFAKGKPLSDGLDTIGKFSTAFPQVSRSGVSVPTAGISKSEALASALMGMGGAAMTGNPMGTAAALLPLASHPARSLALSKMLQTTPDYSVGAGTKALEKIDPKTMATLIRTLTIGGAMSAGQ